MPEPSHAAGELVARHLRAEQRDRRRLADRLHDGPQQILVSLGIRLQLLQQQLPEDLAAEAEVLARQLDAARTELRGMSVDLESPPADAPLGDAVRWLLETNAAAAGWQTGLTVAAGSAEVDEVVRLTLVRVVQEALADVRLHAGADHVDVAIHARDGWLEVVVADDGRGLPAGVDPLAGDGSLRTVHERATTLGGAVEVDSDGSGTRVRVRVPRGERDGSSPAPPGP